jgi:hypothetical protein
MYRIWSGKYSCHQSKKRFKLTHYLRSAAGAPTRAEH